MNQAPFPSELLTVMQFAEKLHLSRATVFVWMQKGILKQGIHFLKYGRVLRFVWSKDLIEKLLLQSTITANTSGCTVRAARTKKSTSIDWEY